MRIAVVWNHGTPLSQCSFRFEEYIRGLEELGHEAFVVCPQSSDDGFPVPTWCPPLGEGLANREFWLDLKVHVAIVPSFHQMSGLLELLVGIGVRTIAMGDSDGQMGLRAFPLATMRRTVYAGTSDRRRRRRQLARLGLRYLRSFRRRDPQDAEFLRSARFSDVLILGNAESCDHFRRFLRKAGAGDHAERVHVAPLAINRVFCEFPDLERERRGLVAVGRWDDPQKNAPLLAAALTRYLAAAGDEEERTGPHLRRRRRRALPGTVRAVPWGRLPRSSAPAGAGRGARRQPLHRLLLALGGRPPRRLRGALRGRDDRRHADSEPPELVRRRRLRPGRIRPPCRSPGPCDRGGAGRVAPWRARSG